MNYLLSLFLISAMSLNHLNRSIYKIVPTFNYQYNKLLLIFLHIFYTNYMKLFYVKFFNVNATPCCIYSNKYLCCNYFEKYSFFFFIILFHKIVKSLLPFYKSVPSAYKHILTGIFILFTIFYVSAE